MALSIIHIGLPLHHPSIPLAERTKIANRLSDLHNRMTQAGYQYQILHASPETGLDDFKNHLTRHPPNGILIGGAVAADPAMTHFMQQIIDITHHLVPAARIMLYDHSVDVLITVEQCLGSPPNIL